MAHSVLVTALATLLVAYSASAGRAQSWTTMFPAVQSAVVSGSRHSAPGETGETAIILFKFAVPPSKSDEFVERWNQYIGKPASEFEGNIRVHLNLPITTNAFHLDYSEWESYEDLVKFSKSSDAEDFMKWAEDNDIKWDLESLRNMTGLKERGRGHKKWKSGKRSGFEVLTTVEIEPHVADGFMSVWRDAAETTMEENGNLHYSLRRPLINNHRFYVYGMWESEDSWKDHIESSHVRNLAQWAIKHDVIFYEAPLHSLDAY